MQTCKWCSFCKTCASHQNLAPRKRAGRFLYDSKYGNMGERLNWRAGNASIIFTELFSCTELFCTPTLQVLFLLAATSLSSFPAALDRWQIHSFLISLLAVTPARRCWDYSSFESSPPCSCTIPCSASCWDCGNCELSLQSGLIHHSTHCLLLGSQQL